MPALLTNLGPRPVQVIRAQANPQDSPGSTALTVRTMCEHVRRDRADPTVVRVAYDIRRFAPTPGDSRNLIAAVWAWVKHHIRFVPDDQSTWRLLHETDNLELLISPAVLLQMPARGGDCDDFTMLICALLTALGVPAQICTVCADPEDPARFSHVYPRAYSGAGQWIAVDASAGDYPGWEVPADRMFRKQCWDLSGRLASDVSSARVMPERSTGGLSWPS